MSILGLEIRYIILEIRYIIKYMLTVGFGENFCGWVSGQEDFAVNGHHVVAVLEEVG